MMCKQILKHMGSTATVRNSKWSFEEDSYSFIYLTLKCEFLPGVFFFFTYKTDTHVNIKTQTKKIFSQDFCCNMP